MCTDLPKRHIGKICRAAAGVPSLNITCPLHTVLTSLSSTINNLTPIQDQDTSSDEHPQLLDIWNRHIWRPDISICTEYSIPLQNSQIYDTCLVSHNNHKSDTHSRSMHSLWPSCGRKLGILDHFLTHISLKSIWYSHLHCYIQL
jgi:hypothetical protein